MKHIKSFINDIGKENEGKIIKQVARNAGMSITFISLLIGSTIICTLGLLINSTAIVIGGMIISPIMWVLAKISLGITYEQTNKIKHGLYLLFFSVLIGTITSMIITYASPIKTLNEEILSRTTPTLLDLAIALVAGGVAALAITQPKVSESLAGVAIATSLMPPLSVSGIGLALSNKQIFSGALLLFMVNMLSIIFISTFLFFIIGFKRKTSHKIMKRSVLLIMTVLFITAVPLSLYLGEYSFNLFAYRETKQILETRFKEISPASHVFNIKITDNPDKNSNHIVVEVDVSIPDGITINYLEQNKIIKELEQKLKKKIDLNLRLQKTISIESQESIAQKNLKSKIKASFINEVKNINPLLTFDSIDIYVNEENKKITVSALLRGDPGTSFTYQQRSEVENVLKQQFNSDISVHLEIISRIQLHSGTTQEEALKEEVQKYLSTISNDIDISYFSSKLTSLDNTNINNKKTILKIELKVPENINLEDANLNKLVIALQEKFNRRFELFIYTIKKQKIQIIDTNE